MGARGLELQLAQPAQPVSAEMVKEMLPSVARNLLTRGEI
jgi:hypothetical protein